MTSGPMVGRQHDGALTAPIPVRMTLADACRVLRALGFGGAA